MSQVFDGEKLIITPDNEQDIALCDKIKTLKAMQYDESVFKIMSDNLRNNADAALNLVWGIPPTIKAVGFWHLINET